jgi:hypothetical protein
MRIFLILVTIAFIHPCYGQKTANIYRTYTGEDNFFFGEGLTLGTDGIFFFSRSCECGTERYGKGTWKIKGDKLYLNGFDSVQAFPQSKVEQIEGDTSGNVLLTATNHFGLPMRGLTVALLRNGRTDGDAAFFYTDSTGKLLVDKKDFMGFYLIYECHSSIVNIGDTLKYYLFSPKAKQYNIHIDFADAGFDREPIAFNYGRKVYTIRRNKLLYKSKVLFTLDK